jgi:hypothetical protein
MPSPFADDVSRENYEKYGHPDGPQALSMGVALPEWLLSQDAKAAPFVLISLVFVAIILPLGIAAWFLMNSNQYMGPNNVMRETLNAFLRCARASAPVRAFCQSTKRQQEDLHGTADRRCHDLTTALNILCCVSLAFSRTLPQWRRCILFQVHACMHHVCLSAEAS